MSNQFFCHNCGAKLGLAKQNFCPQCGCELSSLSSKPKPKLAARPFVASVMDGDDDDDYIDNIQHLDIKISELAIEIIKPRTSNETIGSVIQQGPMQTEESRGSPYSNVNQAAFLEEFSREAGAKTKNV